MMKMLVTLPILVLCGCAVMPMAPPAYGSGGSNGAPGPGGAGAAQAAAVMPSSNYGTGGQSAMPLPSAVAPGFVQIEGGSPQGFGANQPMPWHPQ